MLPYERLQACVAAIRQKTDFAPRTALVLGSGLGGFGERLALEAAVDYKDIPGFPVSTVPGHQGRFLFGFVGEEPVVAMQGRVHYYEGYAMEDVVLPIRVMGLLGGQALGAHQRRRGHRPWAGGRGLDAPHRPHRRLCALAPHRAQRGGAGAPLPRHDGGLLPPAAGKGPGGGPAPGHPPEGRGVLADHRPPVRDTGGNPHVRAPWAPTPWA